MGFSPVIEEKPLDPTTKIKFTETLDSEAINDVEMFRTKYSNGGINLNGQCQDKNGFVKILLDTKNVKSLIKANKPFYVHVEVSHESYGFYGFKLYYINEVNEVTMIPCTTRY